MITKSNGNQVIEVLTIIVIVIVTIIIVIVNKLLNTGFIILCLSSKN